MAKVTEFEAMIAATNYLRKAQESIDRALVLLYNYAPGWAGEVESIKEVNMQTIELFRETLTQ